MAIPWLMALKVIPWGDVIEHAPSVLKAARKLMDRQPYQLKFVAHQLSDLAEIESMLTQLPPIQPDRILLMPQGTTPSELSSRASWVANACLQRGWRYAPRLHIDLYGNTRGT